MVSTGNSAAGTACAGVPVNRALRRVFNQMGGILRGKRLGVGLDLDTAVRSAAVDETWLLQTLDTLLCHAAAKARGAGLVVGRTSREGESICITIGYTGPPMRPDEARRLLHRCGSCDGATIEQDADFPSGTWFVVRLPLAAPAVEKAADAVGCTA